MRTSFGIIIIHDTCYIIVWKERNPPWTLNRGGGAGSPTGCLTGILAWQPRAKWSNLMDDSCVLQLKIITVFFPHFVSPLAADNAIRSAPSSVRQEGGPFSPHPPDAFDVHARKGFRETAFFLPSFSFLLPPSRSYLTLSPSLSLSLALHSRSFEAFFF